ncbi:MAG: ATP synthase F0 subunit B [Candidatus Baltobacteraceae bacterium]
MFLSTDGTFWVQLINFAIFFVVLNWIFLRPVGAAIAKRRAYIESLTSDYDRAQAEGTELRNRAEAIRTDARREAEAAVVRNRADAQNEAAQITSDSAARASNIVEDAHRVVEGELAAVRPQQDALAVQLAHNILGKIVPEILAS